VDECVRDGGATDQSLARVSPVEFHAHVELRVGGAGELQPLPDGQPDLGGAQRELVDLVPCVRKGRELGGWA